MSSTEERSSVLVTGGSRGIGRTVSLGLARLGNRTIYVNYLQRDDDARSLAGEITSLGSRAVLVRANLADPDQIDTMFETVKRTTGRLDAFVHCAALGVFKPLVEIKPNQWDLTMNINARGFLYCVQQCLPLMPAGSIVAVSSLGAQRVVPNYGAMGPTKAALEATVRYLATELASRDIRVNAVSGGFIQTESLDHFPDSDSLKSEIKKRTPSGRIGTPEDFAGPILFLLSSEARWITGQTLIADGGISL